MVGEDNSQGRIDSGPPSWSGIRNAGGTIVSSTQRLGNGRAQRLGVHIGLRLRASQPLKDSARAAYLYGVS
jgi:hypothetical protein